jgi:malonate-semialdehyde dehydrogenase (acetylating)/methylmalonate-semialdehyde dehydrogenase
LRGWRESFMRALHGLGEDAIEFYTDKKLVIERCFKKWSRQF